MYIIELAKIVMIRLNSDCVVQGGDSTIEEMCLSFPVYYPRINLDACISSVDVNFGFSPFLGNTNYVSR